MLPLAGTCLEKNVDHHGNDLHGNCRDQPDAWKRDTPEECSGLCKVTDGCELFTWISTDHPWELGRKRCCLKHSLGAATYESGVVSGTKFCGKNRGKQY